MFLTDYGDHEYISDYVMYIVYSEEVKADEGNVGLIDLYPDLQNRLPYILLGGYQDSLRRYQIRTHSYRYDLYYLWQSLYSCHISSSKVHAISPPRIKLAL